MPSRYTTKLQFLNLQTPQACNPKRSHALPSVAVRGFEQQQSLTSSVGTWIPRWQSAACLQHARKLGVHCQTLAYSDCYRTLRNGAKPTISTLLCTPSTVDKKKRPRVASMGCSFFPRPAGGDAVLRKGSPVLPSIKLELAAGGDPPNRDSFTTGHEGAE